MQGRRRWRRDPNCARYARANVGLRGSIAKRDKTRRRKGDDRARRLRVAIGHIACTLERAATVNLKLRCDARGSRDHVLENDLVNGISGCQACRIVQRRRIGSRQRVEKNRNRDGAGYRSAGCLVS